MTLAIGYSAQDILLDLGVTKLTIVQLVELGSDCLPFLVTTYPVFSLKHRPGGYWKPVSSLKHLLGR
jgi:hypothetical protein